jgi:hypothetical protein
MPVIVQLSAVVTQENEPADTVYLSVRTRVESAAVHVMVADPRPTEMDEITGVGGVGFSGVAVGESSENALAPLAFPAEMVKMYWAPLVSPVNVFDVSAAESIEVKVQFDPRQLFTVK